MNDAQCKKSERELNFIAAYGMSEKELAARFNNSSGTLPQVKMTRKDAEQMLEQFKRNFPAVARKMEEDRAKIGFKPSEDLKATMNHVVQENALKRQPEPIVALVDDIHSVLDELQVRKARLLEDSRVNPPNRINCDSESADFIKSFRLNVSGPRVGVTANPKKP